MTTTKTAPYAWLVWFVCAAFLFYKYILQVYPSVITTPLMAEFHLTGLGLGNLASYFYYAYLVTQLFVGVLLDKYSPRLLTTFAIAICAIGLFIFSQTDSLFWAAIARTMMGFGVAFSTVSYMKMNSLWFAPKQFAVICGLLGTAAMLGAVFGQAPLSRLVEAHGWRGALFDCAIAGGILALGFLLIAKDKNKLQNAPLTETPTLRLADFLTVLKSRQNWLLAFYGGLAFSPVTVFAGLWGNPFLTEAYHITTTQAATLLTFAFLGLATGGPIFGFISNALQRRKLTMLLGTLLSFLGITSVIYIPNLPYAVVGILLFLFGFGVGAFLLSYTAGRELNSIALTATVISLLNTGDAFFNSFTAPLVGSLLDWRWDGVIINNTHHFNIADYHIALAIVPLYSLIAFLLLFWMRETFCQQQA